MVKKGEDMKNKYFAFVKMAILSMLVFALSFTATLTYAYWYNGYGNAFGQFVEMALQLDHGRLKHLSHQLEFQNMIQILITPLEISFGMIVTFTGLEVIIQK